ncbi:MAG: DEAD/DEAH box helicase [Actinobacteria bacterium]|nr:MAG: DEAD/DEAH box helicase [Actinomycetota bacterium]
MLVPTRELASQVTAELQPLAKAKGLTVASAYGGVPLRAQGNRAKSAHVLVATPGRLEDLAQRRMIDLSHVRTFVLDEADRMLDMGFQPQVDKIVRRLPRNRQTMFFSATLDGTVGDLARAYTNSPSRIEGELSNAQPAEIEHQFVSVTADTKVETLVEHIKASDSTLVFVRTKRGADRLVRKLERHGVRAAAMHGDMSQRARERALAQFESGKVATLVATDVAARGLDLTEITHVINFDPPEEDKGYVHRTGRTGRAGRSGTAITFVLPDQQAETGRVARRLGHHAQFEHAGMRAGPAKLLYTSRRGRRSKW